MKSQGVLKRDFLKSSLPPAMLFSGPVLSGKLTAALETARVLSCEKTGDWRCSCGLCAQQSRLDPSAYNHNRSQGSWPGNRGIGRTVSPRHIRGAPLPPGPVRSKTPPALRSASMGGGGEEIRARSAGYGAPFGKYRQPPAGVGASLRWEVGETPGMLGR